MGNEIFIGLLLWNVRDLGFASHCIKKLVEISLSLNWILLHFFRNCILYLIDIKCFSLMIQSWFSNILIEFVYLNYKTYLLMLILTWSTFGIKFYISKSRSFWILFWKSSFNLNVISICILKSIYNFLSFSSFIDI